MTDYYRLDLEFSSGFGKKSFSRSAGISVFAANFRTWSETLRAIQCLGNISKESVRYDFSHPGYKWNGSGFQKLFTDDLSLIDFTTIEDFEDRVLHHDYLSEMIKNHRRKERKGYEIPDEDYDWPEEDPVPPTP